MRLIWSTDDLLISGLPYPDFPILLWDNMQSCMPANEFLRYYLLRGAIGSRRSWPNTGRALYDYFSFLQVHELHWEDVDRGEQKTLVAAYRDYCFETSKHKRRTVRNRLLYVCAFYSFALSRSWIKTLPFEYEVRRVTRGGGFLVHTDGGGGKAMVPDVMPSAQKSIPEFLSLGQVQKLFAAATNSHHRMILRLALGTGLRKEELATFPRAYVFDPDLSGRSERNIRVRLDPRDGYGMKTKGSKERDIFIGRQLMKDLNHYAVHQRGLRSSLSSGAQEALFLNQGGDMFGSDGKSLDRIIRLIGMKAGVRVWTHLLRHTYATHTLSALQRSRDRNKVEPIVFVQNQLGHAWVQTTMVYLHLVNSLADDAVLAYDDELNEMANVLDGQAQDLHQD